MPHWEKYVRALNDRFGIFLYKDPMSELMNLKQTGTIQEYMDRFDELLNCLELTEAYAMSCFLAGLREEIALQVRMFKSKMMQEVISLERLQDQALRLNSSSRNSLNINNHKPFPQSSRIMSPQELDEKRSKGLCYWCDEKYTSGHQCSKRKHIYILEALEEDESLMHKEVEEEEEEHQLHEVPNEEDDRSNFHILVNVMTGVHNFNAMRVTGCCKGKAIHILIDTGSTHNFVDFQVARRLGCKLEATDLFPVAVANGNRVYSTHRCKTFNWRMQGVDVVTEVMTLPLGGCDIVLGVQWLVTLSNISWNFKDLKIEFYMNRMKVSLRGKQPEASKVVDAKSLRRILQKLGQMSLLSIRLLHREHGTNSMLFALEGQTVEEQGKLDTLLTEYADLFEEPKALPPKRKHDHGINLLERTSAINIRPYRYPAVQKDEIEKLVQEMLDSGVIRESNNPYSSHVVLVRKKMGHGGCALIAGS
ncbi:UNVERIFIED_CONTAM: hypothetical protein Scaly_1538200 [Sesamum calycinum]|uniref:Retrotransposon gag domain-containing protein n=1 Tax=Sesamum calycinum TaxID=2727403 RepID=A0AAW2P5Y1_9LAMI